MYTLRDVEIAYSYYAKSPFYSLFSNILLSKLRKKAIKKLDLKSNYDVLDIACGTGINFRPIEKIIGKNGDITAIDYSKDMLEKAKRLIRRNQYKNIKLIQADAAKISLPKNHFDAVISTLGFSSIPNHKAALRIAINSLKPGKKLVILDGRQFDLKPLNIFLPILRWNRSWDRGKDLIKDIKQLFPKKEIYLEHYSLGSNFILELKK